MRRRHGGFGLAALLLVALLAGCAGVAGPGGGTSGSPSRGPGGGTSGTLPPPCTGTSLGAVSAQVVTLRGGDANHDVGVPVGWVVEIQMDTRHTWRLESVAPASALTLVGAQGIVQNGACVWDFQVARAGDATVTLVGGALCPTGQACPMYAILAKFTIHGQ
ncbi:MAG: hypothetical protein KGO05_16720 [Chloroflexota bacterium]|nr:hypothetical protein [Chloroflexota bacterium]